MTEAIYIDVDAAEVVEAEARTIADIDRPSQSDARAKLYTVVSRWGLSAQPDDREAVQLINGGVAWPITAPSLRSVVYFRNKALAEQVAAVLGPHREGASVSVSPHDADADYITRHGSPVV